MEWFNRNHMINIQYTTLCSSCGAPSIPITMHYDEEMEEFEGIRSELQPTSVFGGNWNCPLCGQNNRNSLNDLYNHVNDRIIESNSATEEVIRGITDQEHAKYTDKIYQRTIALKPDSGAQRMIIGHPHKRYKIAGNRGAECKTCHNITLLEKGPLSIQICQSCGEPLRLTTQDVIVI